MYFAEVKNVIDQKIKIPHSISKYFEISFLLKKIKIGQQLLSPTFTR